MATEARPDATSASLWRFALVLYARPGLAEALFGLQDRAGCNVNLILFALWLGAVRGQRLDGDALTTARAVIAPLDETVVRPIRDLRRHLKPSAEADVQRLRRRILMLELSAEREVLTRLAGIIAQTGAIFATDRYATASDNLAACLGAERNSPEAVILRHELTALTRHGQRD